MSYSIDDDEQSLRRSEAIYWAAFERLKSNKPIRLPSGTVVSQNNVAREAGKDPSALKKSRYAALISDIQTWRKRSSLRNERLIRRLVVAKSKISELNRKLEVLTRQRDAALSRLLAAEEELVLRSVAVHDKEQPTSKVVPIAPTSHRP
jgi:hypothetical protein